MSGPIAQVALEESPYHQWSVGWPGAGAVTRIVAGEFTGDHRLHAVALDSGALWAMYSVAFADHVIPVAGSANDIAMVRGVGAPRMDRLAYVGSTGLGLMGVDCGVQNVAMVAGPWIGARRVLSAGDVDNGVLVGIGAAGNVMLAANVVGGNYVGTVSRTFAQPIDDCVLADWTGDFVDDVVVLVNDRLVVLNLALGELLDVAAGETQGAMLATLPVNTAAEKVAHVRVGATGAWEVVVWGNGTSTAPRLLGFQPIGIAGGDFDGDRRPDLCLSVKDADAVVVLLQRQVAAVPFLPGSATMARWFPMDESKNLSSAPLFADIDSDERCDIVATSFSVAGGTSLTRRIGGDALSEPVTDTTDHLVFGDLVLAAITDPVTNAITSQLQLELNPDHYDRAVFNTAEVVVWRYESGTGLAMTGYRVRFDLSQVPANQHAWLGVPLPAGTFQDMAWNGRQVWLEVRVAKRAPSASILEAFSAVGPTWLLAATLGDGLAEGAGSTTLLWNGSGAPPEGVASLVPYATLVHGVRALGGASFLYRGRLTFGGAIRPKKLRAFATQSAPNPGPITAGTTYSR